MYISTKQQQQQLQENGSDPTSSYPDLTLSYAAWLWKIWIWDYPPYQFYINIFDLSLIAANSLTVSENW